MNVKKWGAVAASAMLVGALALTGCGNKEAESTDDTAVESDGGYTLVSDGTITVAASLDFPPFENMNTEGQAEGFSVELMGLIAEEMGYEINYLPSVSFDTIVPMIAAGGQADVGVSSITITPDREKEVDFTVSYMDSNQGIAVMKDSGITSLADLEGKTIGAQSGTTGYDWASENIPGAAVEAFQEMTAVFQALQSGQIDAVACDLPVAQYYVNTAYTDAEILLEIPTGEQYGIAVSKDNAQLTEAINNAIQTLKENGKYNELYEKWFGVSAS